MRVAKTGHLLAMRLLATNDARKPQTRADILALLEQTGTAGLLGWKSVPNANGHEAWTPRTERATMTSVTVIAQAIRTELNMSELHRITIEPGKCGGRPCLRGLRVRVKDVLDLLAAGATRDEILEDLPYLEPGDIDAALEFAARQSDHPILRVA